MKPPLEVKYGNLLGDRVVDGIYDAEGDRVVETDSGAYPPSPTHAEFIVRAVNNHAELLAACRDALVTFERNFPTSPTTTDLRDAIAKAEGK